MRAVALMFLLVVSPALASAAASDPRLHFIKSVDRMMVQLGPQSARASATIKETYRAYLDLLVLDEYAALEDALWTGGVVPLPADPLRFNIKPRVDGRFPIGEKDLVNQDSYVSARPASIGALIDIASRVTTGPVEITSLVRHSEYQGSLKKTNGNAHTSIPMHTMGLAFDIALVNTPLKTVFEIRDVLKGMQDAGDILVIGERQQLVFHVVPHPSRLGYFTDIYAAAIAAPGGRGAAIPSVTVAAGLAPVKATVVAEVTGLRPTDDFATEWWAADDVHSDLTVNVPAGAAMPAVHGDAPSLFGRIAARCYAVMSGVVLYARDMIT